jgi:hypothetical protein
MQRVRIGLTGLAFVFVLVLLAAVFTKASQEEPITANTIEQQRAGSLGQAAGPGAANEAQPKEPLAELGVAPGNADDNGSAGTAPAAGPPAGPAGAAPPTR